MYSGQIRILLVITPTKAKLILNTLIFILTMTLQTFASLLILYHTCFIAYETFTFFINRDKDKMLEISKHFGSSILVMGYVRKVETNFERRMIIIGQMGNSE